MSTRRTADPAEAAGIEMQAEVLRRLQFPGVVPLEGFHREGNTVTIRLGDDLPPLGERAPASAAECASLGAALGRTLGEIHRAGFVHRDLRPEVIFVDADGRPLLSGFDHATEATSKARQEDLRALLTLLDEVLDLLPPTDVIDERRSRRRLARALRPRRHDDTFDLASVLAELAADFDAQAPGVPADSTQEASAGAPTDELRLRVSARSAGSRPSIRSALVLLLIGVGILYAVSVRRESRPVLAPDGPIVEFDGQRYQVGRPGDIAVVGDWAAAGGHCAGPSTVVLLRPGTGDLFVFSGWADAGEVLATRRGTYQGAVGLEVESGDCDGLLIVDDEGRSTPVVIG